MNGRNPSVGRHGIGSPIAKSGFKTKPKTGGATGSVVGTGVNNKTGATPQLTPSSTHGNHDTAQLGSWLGQSPEPFRNSTASANPRSYQTGPSAKVGGMGGKTGVAGPMTGSAGRGNQNNASMSAASTGGGLGQEKGKVIGKSQPRRVGNVFNQPKASFYGR